MRLWSVLVIAGLGLAALGLVVRFAPWLVAWFGNLPGDIRIERDTTRIHIPITSMIVVSLLLTLALNAWGRSRG